ncbi:MAG: Glycerol kinase [Candidatus Doudnabacteria bacterium Gr01-1014_77]|uniref:ATP:glycerol 3-phosphotransferase n=1 Tax=Candidatus Doudnabacteria bacterium Gr01-1014_77 TaxID=2017133 RepID=A0A554JCT8_9BACT|nr:MAG: Glycerol kinase [Candidatus Doudnabacteria bacterium Gr01-1014_77]
MSKLHFNTSPQKKTGKYALVLDIGTSGIKTFIFDTNLNPVIRTYERLKKKKTKHGWVEQDPKELLSTAITTLRKSVKKSGMAPTSFNSLGITNQRETTICWDKKTGSPVSPAIVWEDERTKKICTNLKRKYEKLVRTKTGLSINPYFSASKLSWILKNVPQAKKLAKKHNLAFGTVDTWLLWNLVEKSPHLTDYTNASRTLLFNIKTLKWDKQLMDIFNIPADVYMHLK